jgi:hypothetical protein
MQRITWVAELHGGAAPPSGDPPSTDPSSASVGVNAVDADGSDAGIGQISYENHAVHTGETTFTESGTLTLGESGDELDIASLDEGTLAPSADPGLLHGAVTYRIGGGRGRFDRASGLITSNFVVDTSNGKIEERQTGVVFLP